MKLINKIKKSPAIILILLLSAFLRLYQLSNLPISLFGDETDVGYQAWSLITTGRDYLGHFLPTYLQSLSEWRTPLLSYFLAPFVGLLGPSVIAVRLPVALLGIFNVYLIYLLANLLFAKNFFSANPAIGIAAVKQKTSSSRNLLVNPRSIGLFSALILALTPWHIHYSRLAIDSTLLLSLLLLAVIFFIRRRYLMSALSFILTFYTYPTANLFTPLFVLCLFFIYHRKKNITKLLQRSWKWFGLSFLLLLPFIYQLAFGQAAGRFKMISVFSDKEIAYDIIDQRIYFKVDQNSLQEKFFHNKIISYAGKTSSNYLSAFSPQFLFISGDPNFRHSIGRFGELLWFSAPFLFWGLYSLFRDIKQKENQLILAWLFLAPLPSALTADGAMHATRLILLLPPLIIITALGLHRFFNWLPKRKILPCLALLILALVVNVTAYWHRYSIHYKFESARNFHYGYRQIFEKLTPYLESANRVFINNTYEPSLIKFAFFSQYPPREFQQNFKTNLQTENISKDFNGFKFADKYYFGQAVKRDKLLGFLKADDVYLAVQLKEVDGAWDWSKEPPANLKVLDHVNDAFANPLFYLVTSR